MSATDNTVRVRGPEISLATSVTDADDVLVVGVLATPADPENAPTLLVAEGVLDQAQTQACRTALAALGATGSHAELTRLPAPESLPVDTVVGLGLGTESDAADADMVRRATGTLTRSLDGHDRVAVTLGSAPLRPAVEGMFLGAYRFDEFRSEKTAPTELPPTQIDVLASGADAESDLVHAVAVADAVAVARDFVNTPPSHLYPDAFAQWARRLGEDAGLEVEILDDAALADGGYGGIIGVGKGSSRPPRLIRLAHRGSGSGKKIALVGKGITFDTGGISIKPAANMENMTSDMGGAAAVIAATILAARLSLDVSVTATVPLAENMPSGTAQRPGDVLTQYGGTTVEVLNTDAEGRLVLADAMVRACEDGPDYLIDTATLTGAQMVALGARTPGVMGTEDFRDRVAQVSRDVGENGWAMPLPEELRTDLKSRVADLANVTNHRNGGMLAAGLFLAEFVPDGLAWAHIDVAGPAFNTGGPWGYTPKGGTGVPVRTIAAVVEDIAANG